ncbi:MAG: methyltransferase family protein [Candidatus Hodarchaeales archaeon]|jgi:protein-S-isoprenylcysteine O-methyltransferase Ste14
MHPKEYIIKKSIGISLYLIFYSICLFILAPGIINHIIFLVTLGINYLIMFADALIRYETEEEEPSRSEKLMALAFLSQPIFVVIVYYENQLFVSKYLLFWDNIVISYIGIIVLICGGIILLLSRYEIGKYGTGKIVIEQQHELISSGIYGYVRHPIYLGGLIGWIGISLAFRGPVTGVIFLILYFILMKSRIDIEEGMLQQKFDEEYLDYKNRTKKLIPFLY